MTRLPAFFIRTSLLFLVAGFILGAWMMVGSAYDLPVHHGMRLVHIHFLTVGFFTCMVMGVALWMFPAPPGSSARAAIAEREPWGWWAYGLLVGGLLVRAAVAFTPLPFQYGSGRILTVLSAVTQVAGAACFCMAVWDRTRPRQSVRELLREQSAPKG